MSVRSEVKADGTVAVGADVEVELFATLGDLSASDVRVEVVSGAPDGEGGVVVRSVVAAKPDGAAGAEQRFVAVVPAAESGRLACAARVVPLRPDGVRTEPAFLIAWEPS